MNKKAYLTPSVEFESINLFNAICEGTVGGGNDGGDPNFPFGSSPARKLYV